MSVHPPIEVRLQKCETLLTVCAARTEELGRDAARQATEVEQLRKKVSCDRVDHRSLCAQVALLEAHIQNLAHQPPPPLRRMEALEDRLAVIDRALCDARRDNEGLPPLLGLMLADIRRLKELSFRERRDRADEPRSRGGPPFCPHCGQSL